MVPDLDVFRDTVAHRRPARILYHFSCTPDLDERLKKHVASKAGLALSETTRVGGEGDYYRHYGCWNAWHFGPNRPDGVQPPDYSKYWKKDEMPPGAWINHLGVMEVPSGFHHFTGYVSPLRNATSLREIEDYRVQDPALLDCSHFPGIVRDAHAAGCPAVIFPGHMYENSWQARGYEPFLEDMIERPAWAECMLEKFFLYNLHVAVLAAKAGADLIQCGDDVANQGALMFSVPMWRKFIHSRWAKVWRAIKEANPATAIHYHSDGNVTAIIPDLVDAGLDVLNPVQPECVDTDAIHRQWGKRLSFDGCIGTQTTMPFGTPAQVRARVKECIDKYGREGGLFLSPTHVLEPEVPIANIEAFAAACREYGVFNE